MSERLGPSDPNQNPGQIPGQGPEQAAGEVPGPDMLADAAAGYDPVAEAEAAMAGASAGNAGEGSPGEGTLGADPGGGPEAVYEGNPDGGPSRFANALKTAGNAIGEGARWIAPAAGTALKEETGFDAFQFTKEGQPDLDQDQQFVSGCLRWAGRRGAEVLAERLTVSR
jgi:hypothetical protein